MQEEKKGTKFGLGCLSDKGAGYIQFSKNGIDFPPVERQNELLRLYGTEQVQIRFVEENEIDSFRVLVLFDPGKYHG